MRVFASNGGQPWCAENGSICWSGDPEEWTSIFTIINNTFTEAISTSFYEVHTITLNLGELFDLTFVIDPIKGGTIKSNGIETAPFPFTQKFERFTQVSMQATPFLGMKFINWQLDNGILERNEFKQGVLIRDLQVIFDTKTGLLYSIIDRNPRNNFMSIIRFTEYLYH